MRYLLLLLILLPSCSPLEKLSADQLAGLTPDRIAALHQAGQSVRLCLQIGGPPPAGSGTLLVLPTTDLTPVNFGSDCHPLPPPIVVQVPAPTPTPIVTKLTVP